MASYVICVCTYYCAADVMVVNVVTYLMHIAYIIMMSSFRYGIMVGIWGEKDIVLNVGVVHWGIVRYYAATLLVCVE